VNVDDGSLAHRLRVSRAEMVAREVEAAALALFEQRGFANVTVDDIASGASISVRTFYRYFSAKEDVLQVRIDTRTSDLRAALARRPVAEPPLRSVRMAFAAVVSADDLVLHRRWIATIVDTPSVLRGVIGGIHLKTQPVIAEFIRSRLALPNDAVVPTMLAAAAVGVIQAAHTRWFLERGDLATIISESLEVLEMGAGGAESWSVAGERRGEATSGRRQPRTAPH
jgi:TetR/AcrR family transcriptional regulator, regulator of mycofactocin system